MATRQPPAVVIIARHGARLDAADKQWHSTSPTPYDPPLTYGGWHQARALGAKIATILHAREEAHEEKMRLRHGDKGEGTKHRRKKHKIIIHSSPFTRCVQTSIAISAGLAQYSKTPASTSAAKQSRHRSSKLSHDGSPSLSAIPEPTEETVAETIDTVGPPQKLRTTTLRVDAFLGEWLSPDYFEQITPPPSSVMMVAHAKAELLRPGETIEGTGLGEKMHGHFPGGWSSGVGDSISLEEGGKGLNDLSPLEKALPRSRASTHSSTEGRPKPRISTNVNSSGQTYVPPTPTYAVSTSDPIPTGYVAHARDACVDVDYRWDSMRPPRDWGHGGDYGEEWSAMHKRFRNGLHKMLGWYKEEPAEVLDEVEVDTVLVLVTHGAGCNALIGAVTNQPVLLDVAMASLTMAVRKDTSEGTDSAKSPKVSPRHSRKSSFLDMNIAEEYEVKTMASVEHLRPGSTSSTSAVGPSPRLSSTPFRRNFGSVSSADRTPDDHTRPATSEGLRRSSSNTWRSVAPPTIKKASGQLWGTNTSTSTEAVAEPNDADLLPNFANADADPSETFAVDAITKAELTNGEMKISAPHVPLRTASQRGLWGGGGGSTRDSTAKRRWTMNEQA